MKTIYNIFSGLYDVFVYNKKLFLLMIVGIISSDLILIYGYGNYTSYADNTVSGDWMYEYLASNEAWGYSLSDIEEINFDSDSIYTYSVSQLFADNMTPEFIEETFITSPSGNRTGIMSSLGPSGSIDYWVTAYKNDVNNLVTAAGSTEFSGDIYEVILPHTDITMKLLYDTESNSFGTLTMAGETFKIIGLSTEASSIVIPYEVFEELEFIPEYVTYYTDKILSHEESNALYEAVLDAYASDSLGKPYGMFESAQKEYITWVALIFMAYLVSMLAFLFYMQYFTEKRKRAFAVYRCCGASKGKLLLSLFLQNIVLVLVCFFAALLLNASFGGAFDFMESVRYSKRDILFMLATVVTATFILTVPSANRLSRLSAAELYREAV